MNRVDLFDMSMNVSFGFLGDDESENGSEIVGLMSIFFVGGKKKMGSVFVKKKGKMLKLKLV